MTGGAKCPSCRPILEGQGVTVAPATEGRRNRRDPLVSRPPPRRPDRHQGHGQKPGGGHFPDVPTARPTRAIQRVHAFFRGFGGTWNRHPRPRSGVSRRPDRRQGHEQKLSGGHFPDVPTARRTRAFQRVHAFFRGFGGTWACRRQVPGVVSTGDLGTCLQCRAEIQPYGEFMPYQYTFDTDASAALLSR